jgi:hypothetical protein
LPSYRLYCLDGVGKIMTADWLEASDDSGALQQAQDRAIGVTCEVWERSRFVGRIDPRSGDDSAPSP